MPLILIPDGPGTTVELREGLQGLPTAPRGSGALVSRFVSGPVGVAALALTPEVARLVCGEEDDDFKGNLSMADVYSEYSPPMLLGRVTDGLEVQAQMPLWDRNPARSLRLRVAGKQRDPMATAKAHNGGAWGGRQRRLVGTVNDIATDLTADSLDISTAPETPDAGDYLVDVYKGALLYLEGDDESSPYEVLGNDADGVLTIKGEFSQAAQDADGSGNIDGQFRLVLGAAKELSVVIDDDSVAGAEFSLKGWRKFGVAADWEVVTSYGNLGLALSDKRPWVQTITSGEATAYQIEIETTYDGATVEEKLPCNFCEVPISVDGATLTYQWWRWYEDDGNGSGNAYVDDVAVVDADSVEPHVITLSFTAATTGTVDVTWADGTTQRLTDTFTAGTVYTPTHPQLVAFRVRAGTVAMVSGDKLYIRIDTLPHDLASREAFIYPIANKGDGNSGVKQRIVSNTYRSVTVRSDLDLEDYGAVAAAAPAVEGSVDATSVTWAISTTLKFTPDDGAEVTFTSPGVTGLTNIIAALEALDTAEVFLFTATATGHLHVALRKSFGSQSRLEVGAGTANGTFGFSGSEDEYGTDGIPFRLEGRFPMWGGYDGDEPSASRYIIAGDLTNSIFKPWLSTNLGLVTIGTPDVTDGDVKDAFKALAAKHGFFYVPEFNSDLEDGATPGESAVSDLLENESECDFAHHVFPNRLKYFNVAKTKLVTRSCVGQIIGRRARLANVGVDGEKGLHIAMANNNSQGALTPRAQGLPDGIGRWVPPIKLMTDHGITPILWEGPDIFMFGNRMYSKGRTAAGKRYTITERAVHYHISRDLFVTTRPFIFKSISAKRLGDVIKALREKMKPYQADGWFSDANGPGFDQQVIVAVPANLNPPESLLEGLVTGTVQYRPRPAIEDLKVIISPTSTTSEG